MPEQDPRPQQTPPLEANGDREAAPGRSRAQRQAHAAGREARSAGHPDDINLRAVAWGGAIIVTGIVFALAVSWFGLGLVWPGHGDHPPDAVGAAPTARPRLETAPQPERAAYERDKARLVDGYGWVDRAAGIARIPVEQAMLLMAADAQAEKEGRQAHTQGPVDRQPDARMDEQQDERKVRQKVDQMSTANRPEEQGR